MLHPLFPLTCSRSPSRPPPATTPPGFRDADSARALRSRSRSDRRQPFSWDAAPDDSLVAEPGSPVFDEMDDPSELPPVTPPVKKKKAEKPSTPGYMRRKGEGRRKDERQREKAKKRRKHAEYHKGRRSNAAELMVIAASKGNLAVVRDHLAIDSSFANCEAALPRALMRTTPLLQAARGGHAALCRELLLHGATIDHLSTDEVGCVWSPLMEAAARGHTAAVGTLCGFGADPLVLSSTSSNALSLAAGQGHTEAVAMLLSLGGLLPRSVGAAAAALRAVATRLQALTPLRLTAARKERALWSLARRVDAAAEKTAATEKSSARRSRIAEKRARQGQMGRVGLMWGGRGLLKAVFCCWNSAAVAAISERAASRAATFRGESNHLANAQVIPPAPSFDTADA